MPLRKIFSHCLVALLLAAFACAPSAAAPPAARPPAGLSLPVEFIRARDPDTIEISLPGSERVWAIRLIDCWAPETNRGPQASRAVARRGTRYATERCRTAESLHLFIPLPRGAQPLKALSFDRIPGWLFVDETHTLNALVVEAGYASTTKGGPLGR